MNFTPEILTTTECIFNFEVMGIPDLLQIPGHLRSRMSADAARYGWTQTDLSVAEHLQWVRHKVLYSQRRRIEFIVTEAVLRLQVVPQLMMHLQLRYLADMKWRMSDKISLAILPDGVDLSEIPMHGFWILDGRAYTNAPPAHGIVPLDTEAYAATADDLRAKAVTGHAADALIERAMHQVTPPAVSSP